MYLLILLQALLFVFGLYILCIGAFGLWNRKYPRGYNPGKRFAVIVPAHNEETVIGKLLNNLQELDYPCHLYDVYVIADNCSDNTATAARAHGVHVIERFHSRKKGKGHALKYAFQQLGFLGGESGSCKYDAAVVFDADNLVARNYLQVMNNRLMAGEHVIQCFIDSKNPDDRWIASAFSITFWLNNRFAMLARTNLGLCAALAGTGMCISRHLLSRVGWSTSTLTEDLEYSMEALVHGYKTTIARETRIYDEKPLTFKASAKQRLRWARGQISVAFKYIPALLGRGLRQRNPAMLESALRLTQLFMIVLSGMIALFGLFRPDLIMITSVYYSLAETAPPLALVLPYAPYIIPIMLLSMDSPPLRPFRFVPLFPLFVYSWIVIILVGLVTYRNSSWMPTTHSRAISLRGLEDSGRVKV